MWFDGGEGSVSWSAAQVQGEEHPANHVVGRGHEPRRSLAEIQSVAYRLVPEWVRVRCTVTATGMLSCRYNACTDTVPTQPPPRCRRESGRRRGELSGWAPSHSANTMHLTARPAGPTAPPLDQLREHRRVAEAGRKRSGSQDRPALGRSRLGHRRPAARDRPRRGGGAHRAPGDRDPRGGRLVVARAATRRGCGSHGMTPCGVAPEQRSFRA